MKRGRCGNLASISSPSQTRRSGGDGARQHIISGRSGVGARQGSHNRQPGRGVSMNEQELRELIAAVKAGRVSRRAFARTMGGLGLTAPFVSQLVAHAGLAQSAAPIEYKPTRAGGGALRTLFWQAPTLLNPPFRGGSERRRRGEDFLRAAGGLGSQRERRPGARRPDPGYRERRGRCRRHVRDLEAENRRAMARRPALQRRRCRVQLGIRLRPGDGRHDDRQLPGYGDRKDRFIYGAGSLRETDAVLGRSRQRSDYPQTPVRAL